MLNFKFQVINIHHIVKTETKMEGLITKRLKAFEGDISETICLEVMISKKVWFLAYVLRPPYNRNKDIFFSGLSNTLSLRTRKYENIIIDDLNIDTSVKKKDNGNYLSDLCDTLLLKTLITDITCVKSTNGASIDVLLTNKSRYFHHAATFETCLSDCHKLILHSSRLTLRNFLQKILNKGITKT